MAFAAPIMAELVLESGAGAIIGSVLKNIGQNIKSKVASIAVDKISNLVGEEIARNPNGAVSTIVQRNSTGKSLRSQACLQPNGLRGNRKRLC